MVYLELHEDDPKNLERLQAYLDQIKVAIRKYGLIDISACEFRIVRNGPEYVRTGKAAPFIRIAVVPGEDTFAIASLIRGRGDIDAIANYGINVVTMPVFIPPRKKEGCWYDPSDPLRALR